MAGRPITIKALRGAHDEAQVPPRLGVRIVAVFVVLQLLLLAALLMLFPSRAGAAPTKGEVSVTTAGGYARLVFTLSEETEAEVRLANGIVIIAFKRAVDVPVERIAMQATGYVNAARIDPDGTAVRLALNRKVTINSMAAGEKFFVDLLPEGWIGLAPGLPQETVDDLARRARNAEKKARAEQQVAQQRVLPPVRVRVGQVQDPRVAEAFEIVDAGAVGAARDTRQSTRKRGSAGEFKKITAADCHAMSPRLLCLCPSMILSENCRIMLRPQRISSSFQSVFSLVAW